MSAWCVAMSAGVLCVCAHVINSSLAVYHHSYFACRTNKTNNNSGNKSRQLFGLLTLSRESCLWFALFSACLSVCVYVCVAFAKLRLLRYKTNLQEQQRLQARCVVFISFIFFFFLANIFFAISCCWQYWLDCDSLSCENAKYAGKRTQILTYTHTYTLTLARQMC